MSNSVDNRIVEMQFDNKQFESGVKTTMKTIDNLKSGLNFEGSAKGLEHLGGLVEKISGKFSTLGIMGMTALQNITNSIVDAGKRFVSSITIDPIKTGLTEYETKMGAIQTILTNTASKGTKLDEINKTLNELNEYADLTIYNFAEMTRNIGTFTAAGVDLNTSAMAIKGIANLAAGSGSTAIQASTAMYQLSQAIAAGSVKLQDWNSVVNAGMGGELFQNALKETAKQMGIVYDASVPFRESLKDGWITTEVLTKTLEKFAKDEMLLKAATQVKTFTQLLSTMTESVQSGWAQSWEAILGNKDESTALFTKINDLFGQISGSAAAARNAMLEFWSANGGRDAIIETIFNTAKGISEIIAPIKEAFSEIFPPMTGQRLVEISEKLRDLSRNFKIGEETAENIKRTFKGLFAIIDIGVKVFTFLAKTIGLVIKAISPVAGSILGVTGSIGDFIVKLNESIEANDVMTFALEKVGVAITYIKDLISKAATALGPTIDSLKKTFIGFGTSIKSFFAGSTGLTGATEAFANVGISADDMRLALDKVKETFTKIKSAISTVVNAIKSILGPIFDSLKKKFDELSMQDIGTLLTGGGLIMFAKAISKGLGSIDDILQSFSDVLSQVGDTLKAFQMKVKAEALLKIAIALGILAAALIALSFIDLADLAKSLGALTIVFAELIIGLILINKHVKEIKSVTSQMIALGAGMLLLAFSVKTLASMEPAKLAQGVIALAGVMAILAGFIKLTKGGDLKSSSKGLTAFAIGITILTASLLILGAINLSKLIQSISAMTAIMGVIALFVNLTKSGDLSKSAGGLTGFSIGLTILVGALSILGNMPMDKLLQGGIAITSLMTVIATFIAVTNSGDLKKSASGLIGFSTGLLVLIGALAILGNMQIESLIQGGLAIAGIMTIIGAFVNFTRGGDLKSSSSGIIGFAIGITILTKSVSELAALDTKKLIQGVSAIGALITIIALFTNITRGGDLKASSAGLTGFAIGLIVLSGAVTVLSNINSNKILQGVLALTALITVIGLFVNLTRGGDLKTSSAGLIGFSTGLMILAGVIAILSALDTGRLMMASAAISVLITAIGLFVGLTRSGDLTKSAAGLIIFSVAIGAMAASLVHLGQLDLNKLIASGAAISVLLLAIAGFSKLTNGGGLIASAAGLVVFSGALFILIQVISGLGSMDISTLVVGVGALAAVLVVLGLTSALLAPLAPAILALSAAVLLFGTGCLAAGAGIMLLSTGLTALAVTGKAGAESLASIVTKLMMLIPSIFKKIAEGVVELLTVIAQKAPVIVNAIVKLGLAIIDGLVVLIPKIAEAGGKLLNALLDILVKYVPKLVDAGMKLIIGLLQGIENNIQAIVEAAIGIVVNFINGVSSKLPDVIDAAYKLVISFINGIADSMRNNVDPMMDAIENLMTSIIDAAIKVLFGSIDMFVNMGKQIIDGLIQGFKDTIKNVKTAVGGIADNVITTFKSVLGIASPSKVFMDYGGYIVSGLQNGINNTAPKAVDASKNLATNVVDTGKKILDSGGKQTYGLDIVNDLKNKLVESQKLQESATAQSVKTDQDAVTKKKQSIEELEKARKEAYNKELDRIEEKKYYDQLSLQEELTAWETLQKKYKEGSEERKKIDREVYRVKKELIAAEEDAKKKAFDHSLNWIEQEKYYNRLSLTEELAAWERVQARYLAGSEERKKADREVYRVRRELIAKQEEIDNEYYEHTKDVNEQLRADIQSVTDEYDRALKSREDSLYSSYGLFDKVEEKEAVNGADLLNNLKGQLDDVELWKKRLADLAARGVDEGLIKELTDMGPKASAQIQALNSLTDEDLTSYVSMWQTKHNEARTRAIEELEGMRAETEGKIAELNGQAERDLETYKQTWINKTRELTDGVEQEMTEMKDEVNKVVGEMKTELEKETTLLVESIQKKFTDTKWELLGIDLVNGLILGIKVKSYELASVAAETALSALQAAKDALGVKSPSKEFEKVGRFADEGLINGLKKYSGRVGDAGKKLGNTAIDSLRQTMANVSDILTGNPDMTPTIRPVIDMTNVEKGLASTFNKTRGINVSGVQNRIAGISASIESRRDPSDQRSGDVTNNTDERQIIIQNHYSVRSDADIRKISRMQRNLLDRYNLAKGVPVG